MALYRNPVALACVGALCLQRPAAAIYSAPALNLLMIIDGFGLLVLAYLEFVRQHPGE